MRPCERWSYLQAYDALYNTCKTHIHSFCLQIDWNIEALFYFTEENGKKKNEDNRRELVANDKSGPQRSISDSFGNSDTWIGLTVSYDSWLLVTAARIEDVAEAVPWRCTGNNNSSRSGSHSEGSCWRWGKIRLLPMPDDTVTEELSFTRQFPRLLED